MRILSYEEVELEYDQLAIEEQRARYNLGGNLLSRVGPILEEKYNWKGGFVRRRLNNIIQATGNLEDKRILDLGCGSILTPDNRAIPGVDKANQNFAPWLCRALFELGLNPIGIDLFSNKSEHFESYQIDLTERGCLNFIPENSVDIAHSCMLFSSPMLLGRVYSLMENLLPQLERIVKPDGFFIYTN